MKINHHFGKVSLTLFYAPPDDEFHQKRQITNGF